MTLSRLAMEARRSDVRQWTLVALLGLLLLGSAGARSVRAADDDVTEALARARTLMERSAFAEALAVAQGAERTALERFGADDINVAKAQLVVASAYEHLARYEDARALYEQSLHTHEKALGAENAALGTILNSLSRLASRRGRYAEAEAFCERALAIREKALGPEHPNYAESLRTLGYLKYMRGLLAEAEPLLRRSLAIREKAVGPDHPDVAKTLGTLAVILTDANKKAEARQLLERSLAINTKAYGAEHLSVADDLNSLGNLAADADDIKDAEARYSRSLEIREHLLGPEHPSVADSLNNLAIVYAVQGREVEYEQALRRCLAIREKALGPDHSDVAASLSNLGIFYYDMCRYREAEEAYRRSLAIREKAFGPAHPEVATSLTNLSNVYGRQGKEVEAEKLRRRALEISEKAFGPEHPEVGTPLNNLALSEMALGRPAEAEGLLRRALAIWEVQRGVNHPFTGIGYRNLALACAKQDKSVEAEDFAKRSIAVLSKAWGDDHAETILSRFELAQFYVKRRRFAEAEPLLRQCLEASARVLPADHVYISDADMALAGLLYATGRPAEAGEFFAKSFASLRRQLDYHFSYMSEADRLTFLSSLEELVHAFFSFCLSDRERNPASLEEMYDVALWRKGLVMGSLTAMRARLIAQKDPEASAMLDELSGKKTRLAQQLTSSPQDSAAARQEIEKLAHEIQDLESALAKRSSAAGQAPLPARATWREVQQALGPGEAAVELIRVRQHDGTDWTGGARYVALVLTKEAPRPALVDVGDAASLDRSLSDAYGKLPKQGAARRLEHPQPAPGAPAADSGVLLYDRVVHPVMQAAAGAARVYVAPDGLLNRVAWSMVPLPGGEERLLDRFDLRLVSSTRDLLSSGAARPDRSAVLVGNPDFALASAAERSAPRRVASAAGDGRRSVSSDLRALPASGVSPLPFTEAELAAIRARLTRRGWQVEVLSGAAAAEEAVKAVKSPRLLHLATHGFFLPDQRRAEKERLEGFAFEDPLLRSGLLLSGAARSLAGDATGDGDDGVLTAYEAATLDLHGTELVTLSACETGLGEEQNGEGVFGLRRSFQAAGAGAVLMSLWAVPDRETKELMARFYDNWLAGQDKHEALRHAQAEMRSVVRRRYGSDLPYYWAAFVLVGR